MMSTSILQRGTLIALSGVDGSGKTTQIDLLERRLGQNHRKTRKVWCRWRPITSLPLLSILRRLGYAEVHPTSSIGFVETRISRAGGLSSVWCFLTQFDNLLKTGVMLFIPLLLGRTVICDRYVLDLQVDGMADLKDKPGRIRLGFKLLKLLPRPAEAFLIDVDPKVAFQRKPDMPTLSHFVERVGLYKELAGSMGVLVLDGRQSPEAIHEEIWSRMLDGGLVQGGF